MSETRYVARGWTAYVEEDSYEHGCGFKDARWLDKGGSEVFTGDTLQECVTECARFAGAAETYWGGAWQDEPGRLDFQRQENDDAYEPTAQEWADFKAGKRNLWLATYTFLIERVEPVSAEELTACGAELV